ncbi:MAG TPA: response regulator [Gammaproteobacteria bacterium]|nr:response regulator [Gammaproteobacteria bacterium]
MPAKRALIVDDSKSARFFLSRMLKAHELEVDAAESAEEALEYLSDHRPDVIFMDHLMPGMDGFQAVRVIKDNPQTATIPIMMYTSQRGELYVGQARALGAVGVLPKQIKPVEVSKVLESLHLVPAASAVSPEDARAAPDAREVRELDANLRDFLERLFQEQTDVFKREMLEGYEAVARRVVEEIREEDAQRNGADTPPQLRPLPPEKRPIRPLAMLLSIGALVFLSLLFFGLYFESERRWTGLQAENAELIAALEEQQIAAAEESIELHGDLRAQREHSGDDDAAIIDAIEWSVNQAGGFGPDEIALDDGRLDLLRGLIDRLMAIGFAGVVRLETHLGRFCMIGNTVDGYAFPQDDRPAGSCDAFGNPAYDAGERSSLAFANFLAGVEEQTGGEIRVEVAPFGVEAPLVDYPSPASGATAREWNQIASLNNRVRIQLTENRR